MDELHTIGSIAQLAEVSIETIRFYERRGLLETPPRNSSGYRVYVPDVIERLRFIKSARELGFSLAEVQTLLRGQDRQPGTCTEVKRLLETKAREVEERLDNLRLAKARLDRLIANCPTTGECDECHVTRPVAP